MDETSKSSDVISRTQSFNSQNAKMRMRKYTMASITGLITTHFNKKEVTKEITKEFKEIQYEIKHK
jgi:hypothetical protein